MDESRRRYEEAMVGVVRALHGLAVAFEAAVQAAGELLVVDHSDAFQHGTITTSRAIFSAIVRRHAGAAQMLGIDELMRKRE